MESWQRGGVRVRLGLEMGEVESEGVKGEVLSWERSEGKSQVQGEMSADGGCRGVEFLFVSTGG